MKRYGGPRSIVPAADVARGRDATWRPRLGVEFAERLIAHARNEETGLLPVLELAIDEQTDERLAGDYAMKR